MITISSTICARGEELSKDSLQRLAAAIEIGNASEAFIELDTLLHHDVDCAELIAQGRVSRAVRVAKAAIR